MRVLLTGAAGAIGACLREGLRGEVEELRLSDVREVGDLAPGETFVRADVTDPAAVDRAVEGVEAVIHLGAVPDEAGFDVLAGPNLHGAFHVFDAARRLGVRRVIYASSNRITGFEPSARRLGGGEAPRPDGLYGATKAWGEALGRLYHDRFGLEVVSVRIGSFEREPSEPRHLFTWLSHGDAVRLFRACLTAPDVGYACVYGASANARGWWDLGPARALGYEPADDAERFADRFPGATPEPVQGAPYTAPGYGGWA